MTYLERYIDALRFAHSVHGDKLRKGTDIPYMSHLLAVCSIVMEHGGTEEEVIAALLHDTAEDGDGLKTLEEVRQMFGERVADIVAGCSDTFEKPKPPWRPRKVAYVAHAREANRSICLVSAADKLPTLARSSAITRS